MKITNHTSKSISVFITYIHNYKENKIQIEISLVEEGKTSRCEGEEGKGGEKSATTMQKNGERGEETGCVTQVTEAHMYTFVKGFQVFTCRRRFDPYKDIGSHQDSQMNKEVNLQNNRAYV